MLRKYKLTAGVVLIGVGVIALLFLGMRREYVRAIQRSREAVLRTDLRTIRDAIDKHTLDEHRRPNSLQDLVDAGYLRSIPVDPMTGKRDWLPEFEGPKLGDPVVSPDLKAQGLYNVHSNSSRVATVDSPYNAW